MAKARSRWLKEGDTNTKYFHGCVNKRRKNNEILLLEVNRRNITKVEEIKNAVFEHFLSYFAARGVRPTPDNLHVKSLEDEQSYDLVKEFTEAEIWRAVWEFDSSKSPGPDGVNFGFVEDFWEYIKQEFFRVMVEFHTNGRITKGKIAYLYTWKPLIEVVRERLSNWRNNQLSIGGRWLL